MEERHLLNPHISRVMRLYLEGYDLDKAFECVKESKRYEKKLEKITSEDE